MDRVYSKSREEDYTVVVDWNIGNTCNFGCLYCHSWFKSGSNPFPDIDNAKSIVSKIAERHRQSNRPVRFSFVGGEPTLYQHLPELCRHIKEAAWYQINISSNGSAPLAYWDEISPWIDSANLTFHEGKGDFDHFNAVIDQLKGKSISVAMAMMPETFDQSMAKLAALQSRGTAAYPQPLYEDHAARSRIMPYSEAQRAVLFPNVASDIVVETASGDLHMASSDQVIYEKKNSFTGMRCAIGIDQIVIDQNGAIRGGWCRVGGQIGNVHTGEFNIPEPTICTKATCNNPNDLAVRKWTDGNE